MKKIVLAGFLLLTGILGMAQFTKARLQATGLTCAMCSNAINKAVQQLPFVESVKSDIKHSAFDITFKPGADVDPDALRKAVEDAGFGIGTLEMTGSFTDLQTASPGHVHIGNRVYHVVNASPDALKGEKTLTLVDKDFLSLKQFRKLSQEVKKECMETGKAASCCNLAAGTRVYHVRI